MVYYSCNVTALNPNRDCSYYSSSSCSHCYSCRSNS